MANKLLKTLTIDGVARDIENCRFPKLSNDWLVDDLSIGTSMVSENIYTATKEGVLFGYVYIDHSAASSTNNVHVVIVEQVRTSMPTQVLNSVIVPSSPGNKNRISLPFIANIRLGDTIRLGIRNSAASTTCGASSRMIFVPNVVGG